MSNALGYKRIRWSAVCSGTSGWAAQIAGLGKGSVKGTSYQVYGYLVSAKLYRRGCGDNHAR